MAAVEEQGAATQEIARNVQQASQGTQQVSSNIADVQRGASETGSASSKVLSAAQSLSGGLQPPQARSRQVPQYGTRRLSIGYRIRKNAKPPTGDSFFGSRLKPCLFMALFGPEAISNLRL